MIEVQALKEKGHYKSFHIQGHAGYADAGEDIVCAAVSSAVQLTANGITEVLGMKARVTAKGDTVSLKMDSLPSEDAEAFLKALRLHLEVLAEDYPKNVKLTCTEV